MHGRELTEAERDALAKQAREYRMGLCTCIPPVPVRRADQRPDRCLCCGGIIPNPNGAGLPLQQSNRPDNDHE